MVYSLLFVVLSTQASPSFAADMDLGFKLSPVFVLLAACSCIRFRL
jgi:hypothetical protein